jgi:hypothetical protein
LKGLRPGPLDDGGSIFPAGWILSLPLGTVKHFPDSVIDLLCF